eukprot:TRINITY_DN8504_c0_g1_i1.p1 TRINITY_DN8504_c0_g1~~TRINITY_DN8504_c0_g1_i1.p1  ORF type:complete len:1259 (-),score=214.43 TRINITY_DN8504_c0_g1_i1:61-3837(-)
MSPARLSKLFTLSILLFLCQVSLSSGFWFPNGDSWTPSSDASGRLVVFPTSATNLVFDDTNDLMDVFLWDTAANPNSSASLQILSEGRLGSVAKGVAEYGIVTENGRYAYFVGRATNYVAQPAVTCTQSLIYKVDLALRAAGSSNDTVKLISTNSSGAIASEATYICGSSWDGRYILMHTVDRSFVPSNFSLAMGLPRSAELVYWMDTQTHEIKLISHNWYQNATANSVSLCSLRRSWSQTHGPYRTISADGRWVVFHSRATNLAEQRTDGSDNVYVYDVWNGKSQLITGPRFEVYPGNYTRSFYSFCRAASIASNATTIAFWCRRAESSGGAFMHDTIACDFSDDDLVAPNCTFLSVNVTGDRSDMQFAPPEIVGAPSLSSNGSIVAWATPARDIILDAAFIGGGASQYNRILVRNRETGVTSWVGRRNAPDNYQENRPYITANASRIFWEGNSPSYIPGENATSAYQIYFEDLATSFRARPVQWPCPYPDARECAKVALQLEDDLVNVASSSDAEIVAFATYQPDFMEPEEILYSGFVCASRVCNTPPEGFSEVSARYGFLPRNQRNGTFVYLRSTVEEVSDMVQIDRRNRSSEILFPFVKLIAVSGDGRYVIHRADSQIGTLKQHVGPYCAGNIYVYDTIRREHELVLPGPDGSCSANITFGFSSISGPLVIFSAIGPIFGSGNITEVFSNHAVFSYDVVSKVTRIESTNATEVEVRNSTTYELIGTEIRQVPVSFPCDDAVLSGNNRWLVMRCYPNVGPPAIYLRDRFSTTSELELLSVNSTGGMWEAACRPRGITDTGRYITFECQAWSYAGQTVVGPGSPWLHPLFEIAVVVLDRSGVGYSNRVFVIPPARPFTVCGPGAHRIYSPVMPTALDGSGRFFVISAYQTPLTGEDFTYSSLLWYADRPSESQMIFTDKNSAVGVVSVSGDGAKMVAVTSSFLMAPYDVNGRSDVYVIQFSNSSYGNALLVTARDNYFTSTLPNFNCPGLRPQPRFECINGIWTLRPSNYSSTVILRSDIDVRNSTNAITVGNATVLVAGGLRVGCNSSFSIGTNTSVLLADGFSLCGTINTNVGYKPNGFVIESLGCATLGGLLNVTVDNAAFANANGSVEIGIVGFESLCPGSTVPQVTVVSNYNPDCQKVVQRVETRSTGLFVVFDLSRSTEARCLPPMDTPSGALDEKALGVVAWAVPVAIIVAAVIAVVVIMTVPAIRHKVFPFLERRAAKSKVPEEEMEEAQPASRKKSRAPEWQPSRPM